jgi:hypothetical protein
MKTTIVHMGTLRVGDTVIIDGVMKTIGKNYLKHCPFMGTTLYGDCRARFGRQIEVVLFPKFIAGTLSGYVRQP